MPTYKGKLYRNLIFDDIGGKEALYEFLAEHEKGSIVVYDAYTSASTDPDGYPVDGEYIAHIVIPESATAHNVDGFGNNFESEAIYEHGAVFVVDDVVNDNDGTPTIYLKEAAADEIRREENEGERGRDYRGEQGSPEHEERSDVLQQVRPESERHGDMQDVPAAYSERSADAESGLQGVHEEVTHDEIAQKAELGNQEQPRDTNFSIPEKGLSLPTGEKARFKANVAAIKTLRTLMAEQRHATAEEQVTLSKYVGWGGLANAFDEKKTEWAKEYQQLKGLLSDKEYSSARGSTLNAHYTDVGVIRAMYKGLEHLGFHGGRLMEPSAGMGHFAGAMPQSMLQGARIRCGLYYRYLLTWDQV